MSSNTSLMSKNINDKLDVLIATQLLNQAFLHTIYADIASLIVLVSVLFYIVSCFVCERDCRLF